MPRPYFSPLQSGLHSVTPENTHSGSHYQPDCQLQQSPYFTPPSKTFFNPSWNSFLSMSMNLTSYLPSSQVWSLWCLPCLLPAFLNAAIFQDSMIYPLLTLIYPAAISASSTVYYNSSHIFIPTCSFSSAPEPDLKFPHTTCTLITYKHFEFNVPEPNSLSLPPFYSLPQEMATPFSRSLTEHHPRLLFTLCLELAANSCKISPFWHLLNLFLPLPPLPWIPI